MAFLFDGIGIPGLHENLDIGDWEQPAQDNTVFGRIGATSLYGGFSKRPIEANLVYYNSFATTADLQAALDALDLMIGLVGDLEELGTVNRTFANCKFQGFVVNNGPIPPNAHLGWFVEGRLKFLQLGPRDPNL